MIDYFKLSKVISYALRHKPEQYGLLLDENGWGDINILAYNIEEQHSEFKSLTYLDLAKATSVSDKRRHEISGNKIRALYGHSIRNIIKKIEAVPPVYLYHATSRKNLKKIKEKGIQKMGRQYVHLSQRKNQAKQVALRKTENPIIIKVKAVEATGIGVIFYREESIWLCDFVPATFIEVVGN